MKEKIIRLDDIDPVSFFGCNNALLDIIAARFPKVKIVARGHEIKCIGEDDEVDLFVVKMGELLGYFRKYNRLTVDDIERALLSEQNMESLKSGDYDEPVIFGSSGKPVRARTKNQLVLVRSTIDNDLIIAEGPAGTGKTYTSIALAVRALKANEVRRIVLTRPAVEAGERLGFLPGDVKEKLDPYLQPLYDALNDMVPSRKLGLWMNDGTVQIAPLAFMRGRTLENSFVILDEAQNATVNQLKMFLTRMGVNSKFILTGDTTQIDLPLKRESGLLQAIDILKGIEGISVIRFNKSDIVRHRLVKDIVRAYESTDNKPAALKRPGKEEGDCE